MQETRKLIRQAINRMSTREAKAWVRSFQLRTEEEEAIIACDIKRVPVWQAAVELNCSRESVSRRRGRGYDRIARDLDGNIPT